MVAAVREGAASAPSHPAVRLRGITKRFGAVVACDGVDLDLHRGRIHGILGENGAGKSTLVKVLAGVHAPDDGALTLDGQPLALHGPADARTAGIAVI